MPKVCYGSEENQNEIISEIISGINENDFEIIINVIKKITGKNLTLKEFILTFLTGENLVSTSGIKSYLTLAISDFINSYKSVIFIILSIGILFNLSNGISSKKTDNSLKNTINFISNCIAVILLFKVVEIVFNVVESNVNFISKTTETVFPIMFTLSSLCGNFGVSVLKPFTAFLSVLLTMLSTKFFIPLLHVETAVTAINSTSNFIKIDGLKKTTSSIFKWALLLICGLYSVALTSQGLVNSSYNGVSIKILKYVTGSIIPVVGGFISTGMEVFLSSVVLIKNSVGLISIFSVVFTVGVTAIEVLILSFLIKFLTSVCQPAIDDKFYKLLMGVGEIFGNLYALLLVCGFTFIITVLFVILSTAFIF